MVFGDPPYGDFGWHVAVLPTCFQKLPYKSLIFLSPYRQGRMSLEMARQHTRVSDWPTQVTSGLRVVVLSRGLWGREWREIGTCALGLLYTLPSCSCMWYVSGMGMLKGWVRIYDVSTSPRHCLLFSRCK